MRRPQSETATLPSPNPRAAIDLARDLAAARNAYKKNDLTASIAAHTTKEGITGMNEPGHSVSLKNTVGKVLAESGVFALGINLVLVTALLANGDIKARTASLVARLSIASTLSYAVFAGILVYRRTEEQQFEYERERRREMWELDNFPQGEKDEMVELYTSRGMSLPDARNVIDVMAKYDKFFVDIMMIEELNMLPPDLSMSPSTLGLTTSVGSFLCGLLPYAVSQSFEWIVPHPVWISSWLFTAIVTSFAATGLRIYTFSSSEHDKSYYLGRLHVELPYSVETGVGLFLALVGSSVACATVVSL
ncbi:hypothetical protein Ae201684_005242 [Aphanomyces euteiches]|uniref:Uncharacterized protein n=1 Tax=Aphanomyces euteiches TaxID=100861 RepID=A0A6G0XFK4_9STRA|nr:hypothetical protein Ae201684_005242 [Aphanomyces euteiches]KAH9134373.1 hypothetical protein AeRB84_019826 [Aphanomyces euteiches]